MIYTYNQGLVYRDGTTLMANDLLRDNVRENFTIIRTMVKLKWRNTKVQNKFGETTQIHGLKSLILNFKGRTTQEKIHNLAKKVINLGIGFYIKGEPVIYSLIHHEKGVIPYQHIGKLPAAKRDKK